MVFWTKERAKALAVTVTLYAVSFPFVISLFEGLQGASGSIWARALDDYFYRIVCFAIIFGALRVFIDYLIFRKNMSKNAPPSD
jgi:hypothetical protein